MKNRLSKDFIGTLIGSDVKRLVGVTNRNVYRSDKGQIQKKCKRKVKTFFRAAQASELRLRSDIWSYEEVVPWPTSTIPCLLLLGPNGVGRRTLKVMLTESDPRRFAYPVSDTTNPTASKAIFRILTTEQMESGVRSGAYVEWGKMGNHYYGIRFAELRKIIAGGRTVVMDCQPESVHLLHQPEFNPCTVLVKPPNFESTKTMLQQGLKAKLTSNNRSDEELQGIVDQADVMSARYRHLYAHTLINQDMKQSVTKLRHLVSKLQKQLSWIPCGWAYELTVPHKLNQFDKSPFIPGSSSLSALGIHGLPPSSQTSVLARSVLSSEESSDTASRLARPPPSVQSTSRLYEKRRRAYQHDQRHQQCEPSIPEQDTPATSIQCKDKTRRIKGDDRSTGNSLECKIKVEEINHDKRRSLNQSVMLTEPISRHLIGPHHDFKVTTNKPNHPPPEDEISTTSSEGT